MSLLTAGGTRVRRSSWSGIGKSVQECKTVGHVLEKAGLDYEVEKRDLFFDRYSLGSASTRVPNRYVTVNKTTGEPFGIVTDRYEVIQNKDAFDFVNYMGDDLTFEKAGQTEGGMVYIIGKLPDVTILGDTFTPYAIFRNGFDGNYQISAAICPLRIVCQNQFNFAFKNAGNTINIRHTQNVNRQMIEAKETLKVSANYMTELNARAEAFAGKKLSPLQVNWVLNSMFPDPDTDIQRYDVVKARIDLAKTMFMDAYNASDNANFRGTAWGLVNAYTDYLTHKEPAPRKNSNSEETKFVNLSFKKNMNKIIDFVQAA